MPVATIEPTDQAPELGRVGVIGCEVGVEPGEIGVPRSGVAAGGMGGGGTGVGVLAIAIPAAAGHESGQGGVTGQGIVVPHDGSSFYLWTPADYDEATPYPLSVGLHGGEGLAPLAGLAGAAPPLRCDGLGTIGISKTKLHALYRYS